MTKKHFVALANVVRMEINAAVTQVLRTELPGHSAKLTEEIAERVTRSVALELADFCQSQNSQFNRSRWLGYIAGENGPNGGGVK